MKKSILILLTIIMTFAFVACGEKEEPQNAQETTQEASPEQPQDEEPLDFDIRYCEWYIEGNEGIYDTKNGIIQKDLVTAGVARCEFSASAELKKQIYDKAMELDILSIKKDMTSDNLAKDNMPLYCIPCQEYEITLYIDGAEHKITGDFTAEHYKDDDEAMRFWEFRTYMHELLWNSEEFKSLPPAEGGYD